MSVSGVWREVHFCPELSVWKTMGRTKDVYSLSSIVTSCQHLGALPMQILRSQGLSAWHLSCMLHGAPADAAVPVNALMSESMNLACESPKQKVLRVQSYSESMMYLWLPRCLVSAGMDLVHVEPKDRGSWVLLCGFAGAPSPAISQVLGVSPPTVSTVFRK